MAVNLKDIEISEKNNIDLIIETVDNEETLRLWCEVVSSVFGIKVDFELLKFLFLRKEPHFYLGEFEGKSVSALMLYLSSGVAGLHAVSTLPQYRGRGFGLSISRKALIDALKMGYHVGVLQASSLGEIIYKKFLC